jgi:GT2 family glycosyltransferase
MPIGQPAPSSDEDLGVVVIGRNEGERLRRCLISLRNDAKYIVYVDSGSTDGSVAMAGELDVTVEQLDLTSPFTAARARNQGFRRLLEAHPELRHVFFVDGDCEVVAGWLAQSRRFMLAHEDVAVVCGRRRERHPERSVYNLLCDIEWDTPTGQTRACGGDALMRVEAFRGVGGYRADLICGEEPELCVRLRQAGWRIWRLGEEMTLHDAAMYRFGQWWKRTFRGGYAFAQGAHMHGAPPECHWVVERRRAWLWGLWIPFGALALTAVFGPWALVLLSVYPLQVIRVAVRGKRTPRENWLYAGALVLGKFPEMLGQLQFVLDHRRRLQRQLIEYK